jgi:hypothetical protein
VRSLRIVHRLLAVTSIGTGLVVLHDGFTGDITAHWPLPLIWMATTAGTALVYRRMREHAHRNDKENQ